MQLKLVGLLSYYPNVLGGASDGQYDSVSVTVEDT